MKTYSFWKSARWCCAFLEFFFNFIYYITYFNVFNKL